MGADNSKMKCLMLPAQSGKTRKVQEAIVKRYRDLQALLGTEGDLNIVISANNRLLVHQTTARMKRDLVAGAATVDSEEECEEESNAVIQGKIFSWTHGKETGISAGDLAFRVLDDVEMILMCSNKRRLNYLFDLLTKLSGHRLFKKQINIWFDEADNSIHLWSKFPQVLAMQAVRQVTLVSATFNSVVKAYGRICVLPYEFTHADCYRRLKDSEKIVVEYAAEPEEYVGHVLSKFPHLCKPGQRAFIPGDYTKKSHDAVAEKLTELGFAVIILNGDRKQLLIPGEPPRDLRPFLTVGSSEEIQPEFNETLARLYQEHGLARFPLGITGYLCVQRGVTFQCAPTDEHDGFVFDYGIIPPITDKAEAYQTMARLFGNVGDFPNYKPAAIFTNVATFKRVKEQEEIAVNLARIVKEEELESVGAEDMKRAANYQQEKDLDLLEEEFPSRAGANAFLHAHGCNRNHKENKDPKDERFLLSSTTGALDRLSYDAVKAELSRWSKTSNMDWKPESKQAGRLYICYKDVADPASVVFLVRVLKKRV